jgi:hypothetical protein
MHANEIDCLVAIGAGVLLFKRRHDGRQVGLRVLNGDTRLQTSQTA